MKLFSCGKRKEVMAALRDGGWPEGCLPALHVHVAACRECNDLVLVAETLQQARRETMQAFNSEPGLASSKLASSAAIWWRSELRRRSAAVERMARPIAFAEKLAWLGIPLALSALIAWQWTPITDWLAWVMAPSSSSLLRPDDLGTIMPSATGVISILLMAAMGAFILLWGLALFWLTEKDR